MGHNAQCMGVPVTRSWCLLGPRAKSKAAVRLAAQLVLVVRAVASCRHSPVLQPICGMRKSQPLVHAKDAIHVAGAERMRQPCMPEGRSTNDAAATCLLSLICNQFACITSAERILYTMGNQLAPSALATSLEKNEQIIQSTQSSARPRSQHLHASNETKQALSHLAYRSLPYWSMRCNSCCSCCLLTPTQFANTSLKKLGSWPRGW